MNMTLSDVKLSDKFDLNTKRIFVNGTQALVRLAMMQQERDRLAGHRTAGYVSGYRGSPLGGLDQQFGRAEKFLKAHDVKFQPGLNEDLAATAIWGTQQAEMRGEGAYHGVFGMWYGKGPGVDRSGDVFRHANLAGTSKLGGVLALMGDDHTCESSTTAHQSEFALMDAMMPVLNPAGVQELLDFGLLGWAMSRYSGCWVGLKCVKDTVESTAIVDGSMDRVKVVIPENTDLPADGLNIRPNDPPLVQEARLHDHKRFAASTFARANKIDKMVLNGGPAPRIGIVSAGKSYLDVRQAFDELGIDEVGASKLGLRLYKVGMVWPLEPHGIEEFADGLDLIIVVEEKRSLIETQLREQLYGKPNAPVIVGKKDEDGQVLFPAKGALEPNQVAIAIAERLLARQQDDAVGDALDLLKTIQGKVRNTPNVVDRKPYFCSGCPHNSSTVVPDGGRAYAGIGCHWMAQLVEGRNTEGYTHMGGEGANWIGEAPFSTRRHVFQNLGDGTYNHSGILAIRAAVASGVNITYKILYNDAVAMTGGQMHEGNLTVAQIARQVAAEGVGRIVVVSDEPDKYPADIGFPFATTVHHRDDLDTVQRELQVEDGVTVLLYDQTCAAEKRRRRKRGTFPDPAKRIMINELVCEGCGDCGVQSNCVAITPVETEFGRKRQIDQSACNKDYSCLKGFCPSFVTVKGGELRKGRASDLATAPEAELFEVLPDPDIPAVDRPYSVVVTGIGGTGVVTIGALIGMAAHLEGKGCGIIDMAGLAQKGGSVVAHLKVAASAEDIQTIRVAAGGADLVLGCDMIVAASEKVLATVRNAHTRMVINSHETMPADFTSNADYAFPANLMQVSIEARANKENVDFVEATRIATALTGNSIATNLFMLGFAYQRGLVPVSADALQRAIELNGVSIEMNTQAFVWGRRAAHDLARVEEIVAPGAADDSEQETAQDLDEIVRRRVDFLTDYQDSAYAARYKALVDRVTSAEAALGGGETKTALGEAVARYGFKLMAYKDEYEVARLYTDGSFLRQVDEAFTGDYSLEFNLAPPLLSKRDPDTGVIKKSAFGPWMLKAFKVLAKFKSLRGTRLDVFGYTAERKLERQLIADYEATVDNLLSRLSPDNHAVAVEIASIPEHIRGYGHVKQRHIDDARANEKLLLERFRSSAAPAKAVA